MIVGVWVYCIIAGIIFVWLSENLVVEKKETGERYRMGENKRAMIIGSIIAIDWIVAIPIIVIPMIKKGE